jgi:CPA2 family monovalent cation:H+ antiporter-2
MEELKIIWLLAIGLGLACFFGYIAQKAKQSPIIGYLLAGFLIGPNFPGFVADVYISEQLANIGVTLLMFAVGLSFNWKDLIAVKKIALPGALFLSTISIAAGTIYSLYLGESWISGFVVGLAICVSSTVVIVRVLTDQGLLHTQQGHIVVGWTIVEDLISVFGLLLLPALAPTQASVDTSNLNITYQILWVLLKITMLGFFVHLFGEKIIEKLLKIIARTRSHELFTLAILASTFLIAIGSSYLFGVSLALGAFIAGTIVGKTEMSHQAAANALPMRDAFAVIFFLSVGMLFSPLAVMNNLSLFFGILIILLLIRPVIAFFIVKLANYPITTALTVALAIAQIGEYSFILAEEGSQLGILPDNAFDVLVASAFITIGLNPLLFQIFRTFFKGHSRSLKKDKDLLKELSVEFLDEPKHGKSLFLPRAVVVGFGPIGQKISKHLLKKGYYVLIIDQNIDTISSLKGKEFETIFGDATQFHILEKAQIDQTKLLVISIPDLSATQSIIQIARNTNPFIQIIARLRFKSDLIHNHWEGIPIICDEEVTSERFISVINTQLKES